MTLAVTIPLLQRAAEMEISNWMLGLVALLALLCTSQLAVSLVNWFVTIFVQPAPLPRLDFSKGIPPADATMVVVPTMLSTIRGVETLLEALEVRYLANSDDNVFFALLTDFRDSSEEHEPGDEELLKRASEGIQALNQNTKATARAFFIFSSVRAAGMSAKKSGWATSANAASSPT